MSPTKGNGHTCTKTQPESKQGPNDLEILADIFFSNSHTCRQRNKAAATATSSCYICSRCRINISVNLDDSTVP